MWRINFKKLPQTKQMSGLASGLARRQRLQVKLDKIALASFTSAYTLSAAQIPTTPLVLNSPHSGRDYPPEFLAQSILSLTQLRQSEDCYIDRIVKPLTNFGIPIITALFPRIYLDLNRSADEWPPESLSYDASHNTQKTTSPRARAGLGVVPTRTSPDTNIYPHTISPDLIRQRVGALYRPYHAALNDLIQAAKQQFGHSLLLDCHSMPGHDGFGNSRADIVLGTCHGKSCTPKTIVYIENIFTKLGYKVMLNYPYAGGHITSHYGKPGNNIEAVQIEINKDLYLNPNTLEPHMGMAKLTANMQIAVLQIKDYLDTPTTLAAE